MIATCRMPMATCFLITALTGLSLADEKDRYGDDLPPGAVDRLGSLRLGQSSVFQKIAYSPDGKTLISAAGSIRVWDAATGEMLREMADDPNYMINSLAIAPDGRTLAWAGRDKHVRIQDLATGREVHRIAGHEFTECFAFSSDGKMLASGGAREIRVRLWDTSTGRELRSLNHPRTTFTYGTTYLAFAPHGKTLVAFSPTNSGNGPGELRFWDIESGKVHHQWDNVYQPVLLSPDGKTVVTGTRNPRLTSPDGKRAVTGAMGQPLLVLDATTAKEIRRFALPSPKDVLPYEAARCVAFSRDGKLLAAADMTDRVHVWEMEKGKELFCSPP